MRLPRFATFLLVSTLAAVACVGSDPDASTLPGTDAGADVVLPQGNDFQDGAPSCAYDCLGGACVNARCMPVELSAREDGPARIATRGGELYWTLPGSGRVRSCRIESCTSLPFGPALGRTANIAAAVDRVFVTGGGCGDTYTSGSTAILRVDGGVAEFGLLGFCSQGVASTRVDILHVDKGSQSSGGSSKVARCPGDGGACVTVTTASTPPVEGLPLLVGGTATETYFTTTKDFIMKYPGAVQFANRQADVQDIAVSDTEVVWARAGDDPAAAGIWRRSIGAAAGPAMRVAADNTPRGIAVDETGVYWTTLGSSQTDGRVMWLAPGSTEPTVLAEGQRVPNGIVLTDAHVVWANTGEAVETGSIVRVAKPPRR